MMRDDEQHLSQLSLDLLGLGELDPSESDRALRHIEVCPDCRSRHNSLSEDGNEFERVVYPRTRAAVIGHFQKPMGAVARATPVARRRWWVPLLAGAVGASVLVLARRQTPLSPGERPVLVAKGSPSFTIYARRGDHVFTVSEGAPLRPGDALRFSVEPAGHPFLLIASIDSAGVASIYLPFQGPDSIRIDLTRHFDSPASIVLDDTRGPERIFALLSNEPLRSTVVVDVLRDVGRHGPAAIRATSELNLPGCFQISRLLEK